MLPISPSKGLEAFHFLSSHGKEDSERIMTNEDYINLLSSNRRAYEHMNTPVFNVWSNSAFPLSSPAQFISTGAMLANRISEDFHLEKQSIGLSSIATRLGPEDRMTIESQVNDEQESHKMPGLKRFRKTSLSGSETASSDVSMGISSPLTSNISGISESSEQQISSSMLTALPNTQLFSTSPFDQSQPLLGLHLRKSPSLVELVERRLAQGDVTISPSSGAVEPASKGRKYASGQQEKLKASNFAGLVLRIGTWEFISKHEGDLVAKFYYAKRKLVWEILDNRLKSKIEIQWSDITSLKASCKENQPDVLDMEVSRPPLFFREIDPQPKKHTLWQATSDFTGGQATICKQHYLKSSSGLLSRHYEKILQCDPHLKSLSENTGVGGSFFDSEHQNEGHHEHIFQLPPQAAMHSVVEYGPPHGKGTTSFSSFQLLPGNTTDTFPHLQPLPENTAVQRSMTMHHAGLIPKSEPDEREDFSTEWKPRGLSSSPSGQLHDDSMGTEKGHSQSMKHMGIGEANYMRETSASGIWDPRFPTDMVSQSPLEIRKAVTTTGSQSSNWKVLDEISRMLLEEPYQYLPVSAGGVLFSSLQQSAYNYFQQLNCYDRK